MSGIRPKGPERPFKSESESLVGAEKTEDGPPLYTEKPIMEGKWPKIVMLVTSVIIGIMFIIAFSFCLAGGIRYKQPRYFLLLTNIILSTGVTGLLIFWYYRRILLPSLLWYVFLQCLFLFFQCVTTDIFAWYEVPADHAAVAPTHLSWTDLTNSTNGSNGSNGSNGTTIWKLSL